MSAAEYLPPLVTELKADISNLRKGFAEAKALQKKYKEDVESVNTTFKQTKVSADAAGKSVADYERLVGSKMRTSRNSVAALREEYNRLNTETKKLRLSVASGNGGSGEYGKLKTSMEDLAKLGAIGTDLGIKLGDGAGKGFSNFISTLGPIVQTGLVVTLIEAAVIAAPIVGSTLAAAITVGLGAGVVGLGAYILKDDKQIKKAWEKLTDTTSGVFERAAQPMKKPFISALNDFRKEFKKLEPDFHKLFEAAAPLVQPLEQGLLGMIKNMLPGMTQALINAKPVFDSLGVTLPILGTAMGKFLETVSENGPELAVFMSDIITVTAGAIVVLGKLISWFVSAYSWGRNILQSIKDFLDGTKKKISEWGDNTKKWLSGLFAGVGHAVMNGFVKGIGEKVKAAKDAVTGALGEAWEGAKRFLGIASPSRLYAQMGAFTVAGYVQGVERAAPRAAAALTRMLRLGALGGLGSGIGAPALATVGALSRGGGRLTIGAAPVVLKLDGRVLYNALIPYAQQGKGRNRDTGLS